MQQQAGFWLSPQQANLWNGQERGRSTATLLVEFGDGVFEAQVREALRDAIGRHEALRTVFRSVAGMKVPFQVVLPETEPVWNGDAEPRFDLASGPLVHAFWDKSRLLLQIPSLLADTASLQLLARELQESVAGKSLSAPELRYAQFAQWQKDLLEPNEEDPEQVEGRAHWSKTAGSASAPALPTDAVESAVEASRTFGIAVSPEQLRAIEAAAKAENVSLEIFLLAGFEALIRRLCGQAAFTMGVTFAGREYEELQDLIGAVARTIPVSAVFEENTTFRHLLQDLKDGFTKAAKWQEYYAPETIAEDALPVRFDYAELTVPGVLKAESPSGLPLLRLTARKSANLSLVFDYDPARLREATVERWAGYLIRILEAAASEPASGTSSLLLLSGEERRRITVDWNRTEADYPRHRQITELIEECAARWPERPAVQYESGRISYRELNESANRLAHALRKEGVAPGIPVGLAVDRGQRMIVALLGIMKAGGAYVPLSHEHPKARLAQQLNGAPVLLTETRFLPQMPEFAGRALCLDDESWWTGEAADNPVLSGTPEDLVYVIHTSGSTGTPKGVGVRHRNLVNYTCFIKDLLRLDSFAGGLHFALVSTLSADLGNTCIFPSLISGGCLHVIPQEMTTDSTRFAEYCKTNPIDVLKIVPSHLGALLEATAAVLPRRFLITGGELLTRELVDKIASLGPQCEILNHYGPTETTVGSLTLQLKDYDPQSSPARGIPIGRPIANTRLYILDSRREPVPVGVAGELYIAGDGVAAGYVGRPELTDERFLPEACHADPQSRMYRTGDLARYLDGGNVEFLGRADDQVKIRGFRIELSEIEAVAGRFPGVKRAVVLPREDRLVAWIVSQDQPVSLDRLRAHLKENLPDYMIPAALVPLAKVPLNANGKVDRTALPSPEESESARRAFVAPEGMVEETVAAIWAEVLRRDRIGADEDFFEIGGHSLLATRIVSRLREHFRVSVSVRTIFEKPTVRQLASSISAAQIEEDEDEIDDFDLVSKGSRG